MEIAKSSFIAEKSSNGGNMPKTEKYT